MTAPEIEEFVVEPTAVQLFQFSAATWNAHRIHYDSRYAAKEGYPDVLVQSHLHACFMLRALRASIGEGPRIERFSWRNRGIAVAGDRLTCSGTAVAEETVARHQVRIRYELEEHNQRRELCVTAWASVLIP
jgi:hydroxyacyl-ACP dehydratase HTD2-like protein with hotdog domain